MKIIIHVCFLVLLLMTPLSLANTNNTAYCQSDCKYEFQMFRKYMKQGSSLAEFSLGMMYLQGKGIEKNIVAGIRHVKKAALSKEPSAEFQLGYMYLFGMYVKQDLKNAERYLSRAYKREVLVAKKYLTLIKQYKGSTLITLEGGSSGTTLAREVNVARKNALNGNIEVIPVYGEFSYFEVLEAARNQSCRANNCGGWWSVVLMPMVKLTSDQEALLFGKAYYLKGLFDFNNKHFA